MVPHNRIYIERADDRDSVALALVHNSYTVRQGREKQGNKYVHFVEYWKGEAI